MTEKKKMHLGCHLSTSAGWAEMARTAVSLGADTIQFFTRNPRGGDAKAIDPSDAAEFRKIVAEHNFGKLLAHAPYTLNPCGAEKRVRDFALVAMTDDMARMENFPGNLYVFHPGSHVGQGIEKGIELISSLLSTVLAASSTTTILLETMSGKGSEVGSKFEEIAEIIEKSGASERLGVCMDTCHLYSAGYDVVNEPEKVFEEFDRIVGLDRVKAVHVNDSMTPFASHKDRHEKIGQGSIGTDAIVKFITSKNVEGRSFLLETPNELPGYGDEITLLRRLAEA